MSVPANFLSPHKIIQSKETHKYPKQQARSVKITNIVTVVFSVLAAGAVGTIIGFTLMGDGAPIQLGFDAEHLEIIGGSTAGVVGLTYAVAFVRLNYLKKYNENWGQNQTELLNMIGGQDEVAEDDLLDEDPSTNQVKLGRVLQNQVLPLYQRQMPTEATYENRQGQRVPVPVKNRFAEKADPAKVKAKAAAARTTHGAMHAMRVALWTQVFLKAYQQGEVKNLDCNPILVGLGGGFHDGARENESIDFWDPESAKAFEEFLKKNNVDDETREQYVNALKNKDPEKGQNFTSYAQRAVHDADCIDINRCGKFKKNPKAFNDKALCLFKEPQLSGYADKEALINEMKEFIKLTENEELKIFLEHNSPDFYGDLVRLLHSQPDKFPTIIELLGNDIDGLCQNPSKDKTDRLNKMLEILKIEADPA
jgi:hypothetical protein